MSTIAEKQAVLIEEFEFFDEWMDKYNHIIEMGKAMPVLDAVDKNDDLLVQGCQSKVWLKAEKEGDCVRFFCRCRCHYSERYRCNVDRCV